MRLSDYERALERVSYHEMRFSIHLDDRHIEYPAMLILVIRHKVIDSTTLKPGPGDLEHSFAVSPLEIEDEDRFLLWVWRCVKERVLHEAGEFFRIDGVQVHLPHH